MKGRKSRGAAVQYLSKGVFIRFGLWRSKAPILSLLVLVLLLAGCRERWVSSPEGTATSYVQERGILVYAPRSARVQKVVFDTADNQLIQEPDTPFRTFFNAHSSDFKEGRLEYAKTTILGDIVNRIENREFIREMIAESIARHKSRAIMARGNNTTIKNRAMVANRKLEDVASVVEITSDSLTKIMNAASAAVRHSRTAVIKLGKASEVDEPKLFLAELKALEAKLDDARIKIDSSSGRATSVDLGPIREAIRALADTIGTELRKLSSITDTAKAPNDQVEHNAQILTDALFSTFNEKNYPDMRPREIEDTISEFVKGGEGKDQWLNIVDDGQAGLDLKHDLILALKEQRYFKAVINQAMYNRRDLFRGGQSLTGPLESAQTTVASFITNNIGKDYLEPMIKTKDSLWLAFLKKMNSPENGSLLVRSGTETAMNSGELTAFGNGLRKDLQSSISKGTALDAAMTAALGSRVNNLRSASDVTGGAATDVAQRQQKWVNHLIARTALIESYGRLVEASNKLNATSGKTTTLSQSEKTAKEKFEKAVKDAGGSFSTAHGAAGDLKIGYEDLKEAKKNTSITVQANSDAVVANLDDKTLFEIASAMQELALKETTCSDDREICPEDKAGLESKLQSVRDKLQDMERVLTHLDSDDTARSTFHSDINSFIAGDEQLRTSLADGTAKGIIELPGQLRTDKASVDNAATAVKTSMDNFVTLYKDHYGDTAKQAKHSQGQKIYDLSRELDRRVNTYESRVKASVSKINSKKADVLGLKAEMLTVRTERVEFDRAIGAGQTHVTSHDQAKADYVKVKGAVTEPAATSFYGVLSAEIAQRNEGLNDTTEKLSESQVSLILDKIDQELLKYASGETKLTTSLTDTLKPALKIDLVRRTEPALKGVVAKFQQAFNGYPVLVFSDEPILKALLEQDRIGFSNSTNRSSGISQLTSALQKICNDGTKNEAAGCGKVKDPAKVAKTLQGFMAEPKNALLFGPGAGQGAVINAFKEELYHAFKHRVASAVAAEREADYDYWWLTFHPKAVALGDESAEGQSVIEIGFPRSATPEEQYHRWVQDRVDLEGRTDEQVNQCPPTNWHLRVQAATSVLNDFLIVLDASNLTDKYPGIRGIIINALDAFARPIRSNAEKKGEDQLKENYERGIRILAKASQLRNEQKAAGTHGANLKEEVENEAKTQVSEEYKNKKIEDLRAIILSDDLISDDTKKRSTSIDKKENLVPILQKTKQFTDNVSSLTPEISQNSAELNNKITEFAQARPGQQYLRTFLDWEVYTGESSIHPAVDQVLKSAEEKKEEELEKRSKSSTYECYEKDDKHGRLADMVRKALRSATNIDIAWNRFDVEHILFAVSSAAESGITLPFKIELYAHAYFDGSRRFVFPVPQQDAPAQDAVFAQYPGTKNLNNEQLASFEKQRRALTKLDRFVIPYSDKSQNIAVERMLFLSGVDMSKYGQPEVSDGKILEEIYQEQTANPGGERNIAKPGDRKFLRVTDDLLDRVSGNEEGHQVFRSVAQNLKYVEGATPSRHLQYPQLWLWESRLKATQEDLRFILVSLFQTSYPGVPDPNRIRDEFSKNDARLHALVYQWLRDLWIEAAEIHRLRDGNLPSPRSTSRVEVLINLYLDRHPYVSLPSRKKLIRKLKAEKNIYEWLRVVTSDQKLMDTLSKNLLNALYAPLWDALGRLEKIERQPVAYDRLRRPDFERFRHWSKPKVQPGIQIIDLLPTSRDDLVSMSINEGGVVAKIAAQADASAAYDVNKLRMATEFVDKSLNLLSSLEEKEESEETTAIGEIGQAISKKQRIEDAERMSEASQLRDDLSSFGYNLGARAQGSIYARAKAAMAYSKRREYLDAAITASGRGDNFAKWVVRKSDLRSELAGENENLVAAAHNGFPNGDQPFHILVKIPHGAAQIDWDGKPYILFNSAYSATGRTSWYKKVGFPGLIAKAPLAVINPAWWSSVEESLLATTYPFKWDVQNSDEQVDLIRIPNTLGGRLYLDDTDKVKFSAIRSLIEAEGAFIKATRSAQSGELNNLMGVIEQENQGFRSGVRERLKEERDFLRGQGATIRESRKPAAEQ